jgi:hypothetical protein
MIPPSVSAAMSSGGRVVEGVVMAEALLIEPTANG